MTGRRRLRQATAAGSLALAVAVLASPASAHTDLVGGSPGPGAVVRQTPREVTLTFGSALLPEGTQVLVRDARGHDHAVATRVGGSSVDVRVAPMRRPGRYTVAYRVAATDGHPVTGTYQFTVAASAAAAPAVAPGAGTAPELPVATVAASPAGPTWVVGALGAGTLAALLWIGAGRRSLRREVESS